MKIFVNKMWCDTKTDWGYKSDEQFVNTIFNQLQIAKDALMETKYTDSIASAHSIAERAIFDMKVIEKNNK